MYRIDRSKHFRRANDLLNAQNADREKPQQGDGAKHPAHPGSAARLEDEKSNQNNDGNRKDVEIKNRRGNMEALDRAHDRDRRSDHPVGVKQCGSEQTEQEDLLAFAEDAVLEEEDDPEALVTKEGREPIFVALKTMVDVLS